MLSKADCARQKKSIRKKIGISEDCFAVLYAPTWREGLDQFELIDYEQIKAAFEKRFDPESKRMCESLCASYSSEFGVPAKVVRLTQTFGPGVKYDDGRVFAEFARCAIERRNIVLKTKGETRRSYLYTEDAVNAILTVLYNGIPGEAYNAANEETYCSIYEMAKMVAGRFGDNSVKVLVEETNPEKLGYAPVLHMNLDTTKLRNLGWKAKFNLESMYQNMIEDMKINQKRY